MEEINLETWGEQPEESWAAVVQAGGVVDPTVPVTRWKTKAEAQGHLRSVTALRGANADGYVSPYYGDIEISDRYRDNIF